MSVTVRPVGSENLHDYLRNVATAFLVKREVSPDSVDWLARHADPERTIAAFDEGGAPRGGTRSFPVELAVPGGRVPAAAVTQVHVLPSHRRMGILGALMRHQLDDAASRGEPVAILIASEWPIYGRFGYGPATEMAALEVDTRAASFLGPPAGAVRLVEPDELRAAGPAIYEEAAGPGWISRDPAWWDSLADVDPPPGRPAPPERVRAVWSDASGQDRGYLVYDPEENWDGHRPAGRISVRELTAACPDAYRELWRFVCSVDLARTVTAWARPVDEPLPHLLADGRAVQQTHRADHLWVRLVEPEVALARRTYATEGRLLFEVSDPFLGRGGTFELRGSPTGAECRRVDPGRERPDLRLGISALGAAFLGGTSFATLAQAGLVEPADPGVPGRADAMFGVRPAPFLTTGF